MTYIQNGEQWGTTRGKINKILKISNTGLLADTTLTYTADVTGSVNAGDLFGTTEGQWFEVAASDASDQHQTTAGGVKLYEAGPDFSTRERMVDAWDRMTDASENPPVGTVWSDGTVQYVYDGTATAISDMSGWAPFGTRTPFHYGAVEYDSGSPTDSSAALTAFLQAGGGSGLGKTFYSTSRLSVTNVEIDADIDIVFNTSGSGGISIVQDAIQKVDIRGSLRTLYDGDGIGLYIEYDDPSLIANRKNEKYVAIDLLIGNDPDSLHTALAGYFTKGVVLKNVQEPNFRDTKIWGSEDATVVDATDPDRWWPAGTIGIELQTDATATSTPQPTLYEFGNLTIGRYETAVKISANMEGLVFIGGEFVACMDGLNVDPGALYSGSDWITHIVMTGTHMNCARSCITGGRIYSLHLDSVKFNRFGSLQSQDFICLNLANVDRLSWTGGDANGGNNLTGAGSVQFGKFTNVNRAAIDGVHGFRFDSGIEITDGATRNVHIGPTNSLVSDTTDTSIDWLYTSGAGDLKYQIGVPIEKVTTSDVPVTGGSATTILSSDVFGGVYTGQVFEVFVTMKVTGDATITPTEYDRLLCLIQKAGTATVEFNGGATDARVSTFWMPKAQAWDVQIAARAVVTSGSASTLRLDARLLSGSSSSYDCDVLAGDCSMRVTRVK